VISVFPRHCRLLLLVLFASGSLAAASVSHTPFRGITHIQRSDWPGIPRAVQANILLIDLTDPDIRFQLTEPASWTHPDPQQAYTRPETTLDFLNRVNAQIAVNAHFYVDAGGGFRQLRFLAASNGTAYSKIEGAEAALNIDATNNASIVTNGAPTPTYQTTPSVTLHNAIGGNERIVFQGGNTANPGTGTGYYSPRARTVAGLTRDHKTLVILTVDEGTTASRGVTPPESADMLIAYGVWDGLNFDGGGSTTLAIADPLPRLANVPFNGSPGAQRSVGSNLAIFAAPIPGQEPDTFISNLRVTPGLHEAFISWETAGPATARVEFGNSPQLGQTSATLTEPATGHTIRLPGLAQDTTYYFRVIAEHDGATSTSPTSSFVTTVSITVDNQDAGATFQGSWSTGTFPGGWGPDYRHVGAVTSPNATHSATYRPHLPVGGLYELQTWYLHGSNRSTATPHIITHRHGSTRIDINQTHSGSQWRSVGSGFSFDSGTAGTVTIFNNDPQAASNTVVIADAFRWILRTPEPLPPGAVPGWWLDHYFGRRDVDLSFDHNGSGFSTSDEFLLGTSPIDTRAPFRSRFELSPDGSGRMLFQPHHPDRSYTVEFSHDLSHGNWSEVPGQVFTSQPDGGATITLPAFAGDRAFFRLRINVL
jgi:hypothetical protein